MNKFRPQEISKTYVMKQRLKDGRTDNYNFGSSGKASMRYLNKWSAHSWL